MRFNNINQFLEKINPILEQRHDYDSFWNNKAKEIIIKNFENNISLPELKLKILNLI